MSYEACEVAQVYAISEPVARKPYKCYECKAGILPGEKHVRVFMVYGGETESHRQHELCAQVCEAIRDAHLVDPCLSWGGLKEYWHDDGRHLDKKHEDVQPIRKLLAAVLRRERK